MTESEGITENAETWRTNAVAAINAALGIGKTVFEAAEPAVFEWYVKNYGPEISLFVDHSQIVQLECLRSGIWSDSPGTAEQRKHAARRTMRRFEAAARGRAKRPRQEEVEGLLCRAYSAMSDQYRPETASAMRLSLRHFLPAALVAGLAFVSALLSPASAEPFTQDQHNQIVQILRDALIRDPSILRDALAALQQDDAKRQAQAVLAHQDKLIDPADPVGGNPAGNVTIVEFFDVRCPYCRRMEPDMTKLLATDHSVRVVYKDLPILGSPSILASRALLAAQKQGGYEKLRTLLMQAPPDITEASIHAAAISAGLDWPRLRHDMDDAAIRQRLNANLQLAREIGIEGTPALVVGKRFIPGAADFAELQSAVAEARAKKE